MGAWGPGIYQDDVALDIKEDYLDLLREGASTEEANRKILEDNEDYLEDEEDCVSMILALADTQWKCGRLSAEVKKLALKIIDSKEAMRNWPNSKRRENAVNKLKEKLLSPMPKERKFYKLRFYDCGWQLNDVYAYPLNHEYAKKYNFYNCWVIFIVCDHYLWDEHFRTPIVRAKITKDEKLPTTKEELEKLEYLQVGEEYYSWLFEDPTSKLKDRSDYETAYIESKQEELRKYGTLPEYCFKLYNTSKRVMPKTLRYLGNIPNIKLPEREYITPDYIEMWGMAWKFLDKLIIQRYNVYNLRNKDYKIDFTD